MGALKVLSDKLSKVTEMVIATLLALMSVIIFTQVVYRYVFGSSLSWSEEMGRYILIYLTFLGASVGVKKTSHIGVDVIVRLLPNSFAKLAELISNGFSVIFFIVLIVYGSKVTKITMMQLSPAMHVKMGFIYVAIVLGACLMLIHSISNTVNTKLVSNKVSTSEIEGK